MAKQPDIRTITNVYTDRDSINYNFSQIHEAFLNTLSRDGSTPNAMQVDLDIADSTVTNVNIYKGEQLIINSFDILSYLEFLMYTINQLSLSTGDVLYAPADNEITNLTVGSTGQVLKSNGVIPGWDEDTDTDTVGVTVQEDGVTVAENVTTINFRWAGSTLVTTPASNQADLALESLLTFLWEDTDQANSNIDPSSDPLFGDPTETTRLDLVTDLGISIPTSDGVYFFVAEASHYMTQSPGGNAMPGAWSMGVKFYDNTGTSTPGTGVEIGEVVGDDPSRTGTTDGGNLLTIYVKVPAGTRYIDTFWSVLPTFPLFIQSVTFSDRYRAVGLNSALETPNSIAYPGGVNPQVTV